MSLQLQGLEIPKRIVPPIHDGNRYTLQLPENWSNDYHGFLMCAVLTACGCLYDIEITMKQVTSSSTGMDYQDDLVVWEESVDDKVTWLGYIPFGSLGHTSWWDITYKEVSLEFHFKINESENNSGCNGFAVLLIPRQSVNSLTEPLMDSSKFSDDDYAPKIDIQQDSKYALVYRLSTLRSNVY